MAGVRYTETAGKPISRGYNVNVAALPANRFVGYATNAASEDAIDALSVVTAAKVKGLTQKAIAPGAVGDVYTEEGMVLPVESDGSAVIAIGDKLTVDAATGRVKTAANPGAAATVEIVGEAQTSATAVAGEVLMIKLKRYSLFG